MTQPFSLKSTHEESTKNIYINNNNNNNNKICETV